MKRFRIVTVNGRHLVAGGILPARMIQVGQTWAPADGSNSAVEITKIQDGWVTYKSSTGTEHEKEIFPFQCRYCLVVPEPKLPPELR